MLWKAVIDLGLLNWMSLVCSMSRSPGVEEGLPSTMGQISVRSGM